MSKGKETKLAAGSDSHVGAGHEWTWSTWTTGGFVA